MAEVNQNAVLTKGTLVICRIGERTVVGPCRVIFVGPDYVTVEDPDQNVWQTDPERVERADEQLGELFNSQT